MSTPKNKNPSANREYTENRRNAEKIEKNSRTEKMNPKTKIRGAIAQKK